MTTNTVSEDTRAEHNNVEGGTLVKSRLLSAVFILLTSLHSEPSDAGDKVFSYSMEEMYQMASYFKKMFEEKELGGIKQYLKAAEFKGYIAAVLDENDPLNECAKNHLVDDIAMRAAVIITSNPLDRSQTAAIAVHVGIQFACNDSMWGNSE